jgi:uncharacterized membrane protein YeaQ/YmgE (transglycosylase-associated protein family)
LGNASEPASSQKISQKKRDQVIDSPEGKSGIRQKEKCMYLLAWIVIGAVVGWGAGRVFQGNGYGPLMDTLMGIGGAVVGGFTMSFAGLGGYGGTIITALVAMVGAVLLTVLAAYVNGRRIFVRQLS